MTDGRIFGGEVVNCDGPVWGPLEAVVGDLAGWFMWMYEVRLDSGHAVHVYKHCATRGYIHLDDDGRAYAYRYCGEPGVYQEMLLADALMDVFDRWKALAQAPSRSEWTLVGRCIRAAKASRVALTRPPPCEAEPEAILDPVDADLGDEVK